MFHISGFIDGPKKVGRQNSLGFSLTLTLNFKTEKKTNKQTNQKYFKIILLSSSVV